MFGCISSGGWFSEQCQFNDDANACRFGSAIGVLAFLGCILFLIIDAIFDNISSVQHRKYAVLGDLGFSGKKYLPFCYFNFFIRQKCLFDILIMYRKVFSNSLLIVL